MNGFSWTALLFFCLFVFLIGGRNSKTTAENFARVSADPEYVCQRGEMCLIETLCSGSCRGVKSLRAASCSDGRNVRGQFGMERGGTGD